MRTRSMILAGLLILSGCGSSTRTVWLRDGATEMEFRRDRYECSRENQWAAGGSGLPGALAIQEAKANAERGFRECMEIRGWTREERKE